MRKVDGFSLRQRPVETSPSRDNPPSDAYSYERAKNRSYIMLVRLPSHHNPMSRNTDGAVLGTVMELPGAGGANAVYINNQRNGFC